MRWRAGLVALVVVAGCSSGDGASTGAPDPSDRTGPFLAAVDADTVFVYGGDGPDGPRNDAFVVDVPTGDIHDLGDPPLIDGLTNIAQGLRVRDEILLLGHPCGEEIPDDPMGTCRPGRYGAAALSLDDETWRHSDLPRSIAGVANGRRTPVGVTSDGRAVWVLGGSDAGGPAQFWAYDVAADEWAHLPDLADPVVAPCLAGDVVVAALRSKLVTLDLSDLDADWQTIRPTRRRSLGDPRLIEQICLGDSVFIPPAAGREDGFLGDATDLATRWRAVARSDLIVSSYVAAGNTILAVDGDAREGGVAAYDEAAGRWRPVGDSPGQVDRLIWTGDDLIGWSQTGEGLVVVDFAM